jgi:hypothetical protein
MNFKGKAKIHWCNSGSIRINKSDRYHESTPDFNRNFISRTYKDVKKKTQEIIHAQSQRSFNNDAEVKIHIQ